MLACIAVDVPMWLGWEVVLPPVEVYRIFW